MALAPLHQERARRDRYVLIKIEEAPYTKDKIDCAILRPESKFPFVLQEGGTSVKNTNHR